MVVTGITEHLGEIRARMARATAAAGARGLPAGPVTLVGVTKGHPAAIVAPALGAGLTHFGENYLQEALPKIRSAGDEPVWHFIGRIQSNKTGDIARHFSWAQTVTAARIAERLSAQRHHHGEALQVCIQVEPSVMPPGGVAPARGGCPPGAVAGLAAVIAGLPRLRLRGLMLIPHAGLDAGALRMEYQAARQLLAGLNAAGHALDTLSMGMSDDFELAIEEGSTMIRLGTALFGQRPVKATSP